MALLNRREIKSKIQFFCDLKVQEILICVELRRIVKNGIKKFNNADSCPLKIGIFANKRCKNGCKNFSLRAKFKTIPRAFDQYLISKK